MIDKSFSLPNIFKGIALFTPGGDLIYGINPNKQAQWHSDLCIEMQKVWGLIDSPHFLVPGYTATIESWLNPQTQKIEILAEVYPPVERYIPLLQMLFNVNTATKWHVAPWQEQHCNRAVIETYKPNFFQLWEQKNLIIKLDTQNFARASKQFGNFQDSDVGLASTDLDNKTSYALHLFIRGNSPNAEKTLSSIHQLLERGLNNPYTLKVIDINKNPHQAAENNISIAPTLIRTSPQPTKRIVGQLDDIQRILNIITSF